jgi:hypothetical protein
MQVKILWKINIIVLPEIRQKICLFLPANTDFLPKLSENLKSSFDLDLKLCAAYLTILGEVEGCDLLRLLYLLLVGPDLPLQLVD